MRNSSLDSDLADVVTAFLRDAGRHALLSAEEEANLGREIQSGSKDALTQMVNANLRLVVSLSRRYRRSGVPLPDLLAEGNYGLLQAAMRFDPNMGTRFSTFATWWIMEGFRTAFRNERTVHLPAEVHNYVSKLSKLNNLNVRYTSAELAEILDVTPKKLRSLQSALTMGSSLDTPVGDNNQSTHGDLLPSEQNFDANRQEKEAKAVIAKLLSSLPERSATILRHRFSMDGFEYKTLEELSDQMNLTHERIRQLQNEAIGRLGTHAKRLQLSLDILLPDEE